MVKHRKRLPKEGITVPEVSKINVGVGLRDTFGLRVGLSENLQFFFQPKQLFVSVNEKISF